MGWICGLHARAIGDLMDYATARPLIRSGDLISQSHGDWTTWRGIKINLIRMVRRTTYSHVGVAWVIGGRVLILEAVKPRLRIYPMSRIGDFYLLPLQAQWSQAAEAVALKNVGAEYSELVAMQAAFGPLDTGEVRQCAAYALAVLRAGGIDLGNAAIPDALVLAAMQRGATCTLITQGTEL